VLYTSRAPIGYVAIASQSVCTNQGFKSLVPPAGLIPDYLYWYMRHATEEVRSRASGTTFAEISGRAIADVPLLLAPHQEQHRIVAAIEERFSRLESGLEALARLPKRLASLRRTLLTGMVGAEWPTAVLQDVAETRLGKMLSRKSKTGTGELQYLRNQNVQWGRFDLRDLSVMNFDPDERERFHLEAGDLLVCEGGVVGRCAVWEGQLAECYYQKALHRIRPSTAVRAKWIAMVLEHFAHEGLLAPHSGGITIQHLPQEDLRRLVIPLPPLHEQDEMISRLGEYGTVADAMRDGLARSERRAKALRSSVLANAFSGKLVAQHPGDEPAATLLKRIAGERGSYNGRRGTQHFTRHRAQLEVVG
jgi:type I restriction enzyme S subunit